MARKAIGKGGVISLGELLEFVEFGYEFGEYPGEYKLVDLCGVNLGGIDGYVFRDAADAIERLDMYWNDYLISDLEEKAIAAGEEGSEMDLSELRRYARGEVRRVVDGILDPGRVVMPRWRRS